MSRLKICTGKACSDHGSKYLFDRAQAEQKDFKKPLKIEPCACLGKCETAINVRLETKHKQTDFSQVTGPKLAAILKNTTR